MSFLLLFRPAYVKMCGPHHSLVGPACMQIALFIIWPERRGVVVAIALPQFQVGERGRSQGGEGGIAKVLFASDSQPFTCLLSSLLNATTTIHVTTALTHIERQNDDDNDSDNNAHKWSIA